MKFNKVMLCSAMLGVLMVGGCKSLANIISPPPEDISAVQAAVAKQQQATDLAFALHQKSMKQMYDEGLARSIAEVNQAQQVEIDKLIIAQVATPLPTLTADQFAKITAQGDALRVAAKAAWDKALASGDNPQAWTDLKAVTAVLNKYILTRMGAEDQKNNLIMDVHDLIGSKTSAPIP